jgi:Polysaccharide lyase
MILGVVLAGSACTSEEADQKPPPDTRDPSLLFAGDFETGDYSQWTWGAQCAGHMQPDERIERGTITVVRDPVAAGLYAARFDLPAATKNSACEVLRKRTLKLGEEWYALEFRLPRGWQEPSLVGWGLDIAQLNYQSIWGSPLALKAHADRVKLQIQSGYCLPFGSPEPGCEYTSGFGANSAGANIKVPLAIPPERFAVDVWHQVLVHIRWSADDDGAAQVFHRRRGDAAWAQTIDVAGFPTVQWKDGYSPTQTHSTSDKIGAYRGRSATPLTVWHDNFCVATSRTAAESCL